MSELCYQRKSLLPLLERRTIDARVLRLPTSSRAIYLAASAFFPSRSIKGHRLDIHDNLLPSALQRPRIGHSLAPRQQPPAQRLTMHDEDPENSSLLAPITSDFAAGPQRDETHPPSFLDFPAEIRNAVYTLLFLRNEPIDLAVEKRFREHLYVISFQVWRSLRHASRFMQKPRRFYTPAIPSLFCLSRAVMLSQIASPLQLFGCHALVCRAFLWRICTSWWITATFEWLTATQLTCFLYFGAYGLRRVQC